jgi:excisionase family DNA binding protein
MEPKGNRQLVRLVEVPSHRPWATVRALRRWVYEKRIPSYKAGGFVLLDLAELDAFAEQGRREAADAS